MGKVKTIGRGPDNDLRFSNSDISCNHAKVTLLDNGDFLAEDLDSTNGTFVNGYRINKAVISTLDELRLSESTIVNQVELFGLKGLHSKLVKSDPLDFSDEFNLLRYVWDDFQKTRINIKKKYQKKITLIRAGITLAPLFIWQILQIFYISHLDSVKDIEIIKTWPNKYIIFSVLGSAIGIYATESMTIDEEISKLDENFRVKYVCPNPDCRTQLGNVPWQSYLNQGRCFTCGAKYRMD